MHGTFDYQTEKADRSGSPLTGEQLAEFGHVAALVVVVLLGLVVGAIVGLVTGLVSGLIALC